MSSVEKAVEKADEEQVPMVASPPEAKRPSFHTTFGLALIGVIAVCTILMVGELASLVSFASSDGQTQIIIGGTGAATSPNGSTDSTEDTTIDTTTDTTTDNVPDSLPSLVNRGENTCAGAKIDLPNADCIVDAMTNVGPQAGANVTKGYQGNMEVDVVPITTPYYQAGLCPVNVHWHLGAEHNSAGEYDENGLGPKIDDLDGLHRRMSASDEEIRQGHQCMHYDEEDARFTKEYDWKYCKDMEVGQTYEVHWPHSAAGACGTPNQYQTPFYDGVFCNLDLETLLTLQPQDIANAVGVQAQVFTVVNDEAYFWPDLMRGMIVDGDMGTDIAKYTGSTTGDSRNNEICSSYTPITWQVDRKCHMISASSFDKLCYDMMQQRDDMSGDVYPHGSRETVADELAANNYQNRWLRTN